MTELGYKMLLWSRHRTAIRSIIWQAGDVIPTTDMSFRCCYEYLCVDKNEYVIYAVP